MSANEELAIGRDDSIKRRERIFEIQRISFTRDQPDEWLLAVNLYLASRTRRDLFGAAGRDFRRSSGKSFSSIVDEILLFHIAVSFCKFDCSSLR